MSQYKEFYKRHLPHWHPSGATFFITFRLKGSLPKETLERLRQYKAQHEAILDSLGSNANQMDLFERQMFYQWDVALAQSNSHIAVLEETEVAQVIVEALQYRDGKVYELLAYCVMPNHVHLVVTFGQDEKLQPANLPKVLHSLKRYTSGEINCLLNRQGALWQDESYDRVVRDDRELIRIIRYIAHNPVKAGFVTHWEEWQWTFVHPDYVDMIGE